jgi:pyruvate kinase
LAFVACEQDWLDIDFAISQKVDFIAVSFVKTADVLGNVKSYISSRLPPGASDIEVVAKIESCEALPNIASIVQAADLIMIARGDLGTSRVL